MRRAECPSVEDAEQSSAQQRADYGANDVVSPVPYRDYGVRDPFNVGYPAADAVAWVRANYCPKVGETADQEALAGQGVLAGERE
jgi:hypothetical protein